MDGSQVINPYLSGNFAPVRSEDDFELEVMGEIPAGLAGAFYRNGPNPQFEPRDAYHWFSGDGMIHGFFVEDGKVRYRNRYVRTPKWELEHAAGQVAVRHLRQPDDHRSVGDGQGLAASPTPTSSGTPGELLALEEGHKPFELDPATLESRGYADDYRGKVTAHPKLDPETGEMVWFAYSAGAGAAERHLLLRRHRQDRQGGAPQRLRGAVRRDGARLPGDPAPRALPDPAADRQPAAGDERRRRRSPGSRTRARTSG